MIGYGPNPNIINYGPPPNMVGFWQPAEMVVHESQPGMYYEQSEQQLQQGPQQELSEIEPPIEVIEYQQKPQIPGNESSAQNTSTEEQDSNLLLQTDNFLSDPNYLPRNDLENVLARATHSPDLSPIDNIWSMVAEKLAHHHSPASMIDDSGRVEAVWTALPVTLFDSMPIQITAVIAARSGCSRY
ncbi:uncharacterized protein LOC111623273 [Centruroides sculpturatus]|uniref:uncharacterized protein LOC111623273 n=1 Tax=Centruroides sculpturatus TaxID=218467 RepID=UPI000C6D1074|nr:uncharacterized protein LOC111623273 [Centruroides sculpturatus]